MDKIFTFNNWFIGFCALLVVAVLGSNYIRDQRIMEQAKLIGRQDAEWTWAAQGISTTVDELDAKILKRTDNDAEVEVQGKQKIVMLTPGNPALPLAGSSPALTDYKAILTLYKNGNSKFWLLGKVEEQ